MANITYSVCFNNEVCYVDRIGMYGSMTYECASLMEATALAREIASMNDVLYVRIWN